jgi:hypothetical protein
MSRKPTDLSRIKWSQAGACVSSRVSQVIFLALRIHLAEQGRPIIVAVAAWLGDTVETVHQAYAHLMPDADDRGRTAMDQVFNRVGHEGSALNVPSGGTE